MDLVDLIARTRFLGREFLVWLWFESETFDGRFELPRIGAFQLWLESSITLEREHQGREQSKLIGAAPSTTSEAHEALRLGKLPTQARFHLEIDGRGYGAVLHGDTLALSAVTLPQLIQREEDERFHERMALLQEVEEVRDALYATFLALRFGSDWDSAVLPRLQDWIADRSPTDLSGYCELRTQAGRGLVASSEPVDGSTGEEVLNQASA